jgi:hypothetical protein
MIVRALAALVLLTALPLLAQPAPPSIEREDEEEGCVEGRIRAYLERHGVAGRIDAETQLYVTREFQAALERERVVSAHERRERGIRAIAGSEWVSLGPSNGAGRATAVAFHPTAPGTAIIGAAGGGAWKTTDSGLTWQPLTETLANLSVGAIAFASSNANRVYLGTGEGGIAGDFIPGIGLLASDDGGATWTLPTSVLATQFFRLSVNPADPNDLIAATNLGVMRSKGGQNARGRPPSSSPPAAAVRRRATARSPTSCAIPPRPTRSMPPPSTTVVGACATAVPIPSSTSRRAW